MHGRIVGSGFVAFALVAFLSTPSSAYAEMLKFKTTMDAAQEVPSNDSKGKGTAELTYDTTSKSLTWTITFEGLITGVVASFIGMVFGIALAKGLDALFRALGKTDDTDETTPADYDERIETGRPAPVVAAPTG